MYSQKFRGDHISEEDTLSTTTSKSKPTIVPSIRIPRRRDSKRDSLRNRGRVVSGELCAYKALFEAGLPENTPKPLPPLPQEANTPQDSQSILSELIDSYAESHKDNTPTARYLATVRIDPALLNGFTS